MSYVCVSLSLQLLTLFYLGLSFCRVWIYFPLTLRQPPCFGLSVIMSADLYASLSPFSHPSPTPPSQSDGPCSRDLVTSIKLADLLSDWPHIGSIIQRAHERLK